MQKSQGNDKNPHKFTADKTIFLTKKATWNNQIA